MANYVWVPVGGDDGQDSFGYQLTANLATFKGKMIARGPRDPYADNYGTWQDLKAGDKLSICGHGAEKSTKIIGCETDNGNVIWTHQALANAIASHVSAAQKTAAIQYELLMCWSADSILWRDPFAYRLAADLGALGFNGQVIGYKGTVLMYGGGPSLMVQGSGRFTSQFGSTVKGPQFAQAYKPKADDALYVDKFNHYDFSKQRRAYHIP